MKPLRKRKHSEKAAKSRHLAMVAVIYLHKAHTNTFYKIGWTTTITMTLRGERLRNGWP